MAQKLETKKSSQSNDELRRELSKFKGMGKYVSSSWSPSDGCSNTDTLGDNNWQTSVRDNDQLCSLRQHVKSVAESLKAVVESDNDGEANFINVTRRRQKFDAVQPNSSSLQQARVPTVSRGLQTVCDSEPRTSDVATHTGPQRTQRNSTYATATANQSQSGTHNRQTHPQVAIIGTSLVRGLGTRLIKRGIQAITFMFPGAEIPVLRDRIPGILNSKYQSDIVVLQCGGNDAENGRPPAQTIWLFDTWNQAMLSFGEDHHQ